MGQPEAGREWQGDRSVRVCVWTCASGASALPLACSLDARPLLACRDAHKAKPNAVRHTLGGERAKPSDKRRVPTGTQWAPGTTSRLEPAQGAAPGGRAQSTPVGGARITSASASVIYGCDEPPSGPARPGQLLAFGLLTLVCVTGRPCLGGVRLTLARVKPVGASTRPAGLVAQHGKFRAVLV